MRDLDVPRRPGAIRVCKRKLRWSPVSSCFAKCNDPIQAVSTASCFSLSASVRCPALLGVAASPSVDCFINRFPSFTDSTVDRPLPAGRLAIVLGINHPRPDRSTPSADGLRPVISECALRQRVLDRLPSLQKQQQHRPFPPFILRLVADRVGLPLRSRRSRLLRLWFYFISSPARN